MNVDKSRAGINIVQLILDPDTLVTRDVIDDALDKFCAVLREASVPVKVLFDFSGAGVEDRSEVRRLAARLKSDEVQALIINKLECSVVVGSSLLTRVFLKLLFYFYPPKKDNMVVGTRERGITELCAAVDGKFAR